ncbi:MAG TPA: hypothetical protein VGL29_07190 [Blastocatellia bacterium]|jgi:hypothetical protein
MKQESVRRFEITPSQYELFRFSVPYPTTLNIQLFATAPVNLVLLDADDKTEYENGKSTTHSYAASWGRRTDLNETIKVDPGTWYLAVEGSTESSAGRIKVSLGS